MKFFIIAAAAALLPTILWSGEPASAGVAAIMDERLAPKPVKTEYFDGLFNLVKSSKAIVETPSGLSEAQKQTIRKTFADYWKIVPELNFVAAEKSADSSPEGYSLKVSKDAIKISAGGFDGVRHALKTLRQLSEYGRDGDGYYIQLCEISDRPALAFRAVHLCIYPEKPLRAPQNRRSCVFARNYADSAAHCSGARIRRDKRGRQARDTHSQP